MFPFFFLTHPPPLLLYTLSLHDALPISECFANVHNRNTVLYPIFNSPSLSLSLVWRLKIGRSEEHTSELQSRGQLVCRLLLEKKKTRAQVKPSCARSEPDSIIYFRHDER